MGSSGPDAPSKGLGGARRWFVFGLGVALAALGAFLLLPQRVPELTWYVAASERAGVDAALVIDTRGAPLRLEGEPGESSRVVGDGGPGFELGARILVTKKQSIDLRLVAPSGEVVWEYPSPSGRSRGRLPLTTLNVAGEWRFEVSAQGSGSVAMVKGFLRGSRWDGASGGNALPIGWVVAGVLAAVAVWFGRAGSRVAAGALLLVGVTMPLLGGGVREVFVAFPPGEVAMVVVTALLVVGGALALGWTWPRTDGPPPRRADVVIAFMGAIVLAVGFQVHRNLGPCVENPCLPQEVVDDALVGLGAMAGLLLIGLGSWRGGRRSATNGRCLRLVARSLLGCVLFAIAGLVLGLGAFVVGLTGWGIGLNDQGPDPSLAAFYLGCTLLICGLLGWASYLSFHGAAPGRKPPKRSPLVTSQTATGSPASGPAAGAGDRAGDQPEASNIPASARSGVGDPGPDGPPSRGRARSRKATTEP